MADRIDRSLTLLWAVLGGAVFLAPRGYLSRTEIALWAGVAWLAVMAGLCYLRWNSRRA